MNEYLSRLSMDLQVAFFLGRRVVDEDATTQRWPIRIKSGVLVKQGSCSTAKSLLIKLMMNIKANFEVSQQRNRSEMRSRSNQTKTES
jgi:hypothetical protein